ncbi:MAG TPA: iron-containing alcohol dehydrogenase [Ktedonobacteraceae bacterium]|nr:iron-containing alcohol dehydrogenase [Ktedonobacteraceae bacterium]
MAEQNTLEGEYFFLPQEHILFGSGSLSGLADEVARVGGSRALIITGRSLATQTDVIASVTQALARFHAGTYTGIRQHTPKSDVAQAVEQAHALRADVLVSVGGGSPIDATKAVAMTLFQERGVFIPHIAIPTTLAAAEFSHLVGVTDDALKLKGGFAHTQVTPRSVILDAQLTLPTPMQLWLSTGIRALDHAVETLYAPGIHPINDILALEAIRKLFTYLPRSKAHPDDLHARTELQLAAWMSFFGEVNTPLGLSHNLGRRIGASYNVPHGVTSCILLPHVMRALAPHHIQPLMRITQALQLTDDRPSELEAALRAADAVQGLVRRLGLPQRLQDVGVTATEFHKIAATTPSRELSVGEVEEVLRQAL